MVKMCLLRDCKQSQDGSKQCKERVGDGIQAMDDPVPVMPTDRPSKSKLVPGRAICLSSLSWLYSD